MAEDAKAPGEELGAHPVALGVLVGQETNGGLGHGESHSAFGVGQLLASLRRGRYHDQTPCPAWLPIGSRGSISWCSQLPRSQVWFGSSQISQARFGPEPAMTLR